MKRALNKAKLVEKTSLSMSTIDALEKAGNFPKRFYITDRRAAWNEDEAERWLDERQGNSLWYLPEKSPRLRSAAIDLVVKMMVTNKGIFQPICRQ